LIALGRTAEARLAAEQVTAVLHELDGGGLVEVEVRLAVSEAFAAAGDPARARAELAEMLHQAQLCADDIADPFWKDSYLTRNPHVTRALALAREWGAPGLPRTGA
jgi:hypothetical protein